MGTLCVVALSIGILKTHGGDGEHFGSLFAGIVVFVTALSAMKAPT